MENGLSALLDLSRSGRSPDDLLTLGEEFDALERLKILRLERVRQLVAEYVGEPDRQRAMWRQIAAWAAEDGVAELHRNRGLWFQMLENVIGTVRQLMDITARIDRLSPGAVPGAVPGADRLPDVLRQLQESRDLFAERWHDEDDLVAMIRSETRPLTAAQLDALVKKYPPPAEWYDAPQGERPW